MENATDAGSLFKQFEKLQRAREQFEIRWKLNLAFYKGRQYVFWNKSSRRIDSLPVEDGEKPRHRVRLVSNQIGPGVEKLIAQMNKTKPVMHAKAGNSDLDSMQAASVAEQLLEDVEESESVAAKKREVLKWAAIAGKGFWRIMWDEQGGDPINISVDPNGQPIIKPLERKLFHEELGKQGIDPNQFVQTLWPGKVRIDVLSPFEVVVDPMAKTIADAKYAICVHPMSVHEVQAKYNQTVVADAKISSPDDSIPGAPPTMRADENDAVNVYHGYYLPCPTTPKGRYVVFTKDRILYDKPWEFPIKTLPLVEFIIDEFPGEMWSYGLVDKAVPLQKQLNRSISQIAEYNNIVVAPRLIAPYGSFREKLSNEPGAIWQYNPVGPPPNIMTMPPLPPSILQQTADTAMRLREVFYQNEMTQGQVPPNIEAAAAIDLLQEMASDGIAPLIDALERSLCEAANMCVNYMRQHYDLQRVIHVVGVSNIAKAKAFMERGAVIKVESGSGLPRTRAGRQAAIERLVQMGVVPPAMAGKYLDTANAREIQAKLEADEDQALREHDKLMRGEPINGSAVQQAMQQVNTVDPQIGAPLAMVDPNAAQQMIEEASLAPLEYENLAVHLEIHRQHMTSPEFEATDPEIQMRFIRHFVLTQQAMAQPPQVESPRVNLQLRGAVGGQTAAAILNNSGVQIDAETVANDTPLDTVVFNSKDKPDAPDGDGGQEYLKEYEDALRIKQAEAGIAANEQDVQNKADMARATVLEKMARAQQVMNGEGQK